MPTRLHIYIHMAIFRVICLWVEWKCNQLKGKIFVIIIFHTKYRMNIYKIVVLLTLLCLWCLLLSNLSVLCSFSYVSSVLLLVICIVYVGFRSNRALRLNVIFVEFHFSAISSPTLLLLCFDLSHSNSHFHSLSLSIFSLPHSLFPSFLSISKR